MEKWLTVMIAVALFITGCASPRLEVRRVNFSLLITLTLPEAEKVCVIGDFNNWDPEAGIMKKEGNGVWVYELKGLEKGIYHFSFIVDGKRYIPPEGWERAPDIFGEENLILRVR